MSSHENITSIGIAIASRVLLELGEQAVNTDYLETGSTSTAFRVSSDRSEYILRVATPRGGKTTSYESDFLLRNSIWNENTPVAKPIATDQSFDTGIECVWAIDEYRIGHHPVRANVASLVSNQLGSLLRKLHSLPVTGFGQLENSRDRLRGLAENPLSGLLTRFESPWPFSNDSLKDHPSVLAQPILEEKLKPLESRLVDFVQQGAPVIVHSDLHERQLLEHEGKLTALLDFNDAVVGRLEWDFGSYLYFHGDNALSDLLDGYSVNSGEKADFTRLAALASLLIALHHGNRGKVLGRPHRIEASARFLESRLC